MSLPVSGSFEVEVESKHKFTIAKFYVVPGNSGALLSYQTANELGLIQLINATSSSETGPANLVRKYSNLFSGIGKLKDYKVKLHIEKTVQPIAQSHRRIPFHIRKKVEAELKMLEDNDIIEKVDGPTPWVSPIVVVPKPHAPDKIRLCVDMRLPNQAIKRERHVTPTVDELIHDLNGSSVFSKLDLNAGYHQLELEHESRNITTFSTHVGLRRYKRLSFGISSAAELF